MGRGIKHILYGLFFLFVFALIAGASYWFFFRAKPTCEDGILNQGEEQTDCGGECTPCEIKNFKLAASEVQIISAGEGKTSLVVTISNSNQNFGVAGIDYSLDLRSPVGGRLRLIEGKTTIYPQAVRHIVESGLPINPLDIGRVNLKMDEALDLVPARDLPQREVLIRQLKPALVGGAIKVEGVATNVEGGDINILKLSALLRDPQGKLVGATTTTLSELGVLSGKAFSLFFPSVVDLSLEELKVEIFWEIIS
jgi:hypothetical protein